MPNVSNLVKTIQDIMRKDAGTYGDAQRLEQLGWMFFLKIFDDREKEMEVLRDDYKSPLPKDLRWSQWATDEQGITGDAILDPACGTGGFLVCAIEHLRRQAKTEADERAIQDCFAGIEKKHLPHVLCMTNLLLHGIDVPSNVRHDNTLARPLRDWGPKERVDVIVTNPPFGGMEEDGIESNFPSEFRTRETADLFLVLLMKILKPGGRAGLVLPDGTLFGEGVKTRIKEALLTDCNLHTIVRLPNGVFNPYTGIRTNLIFFTKCTPTKNVWYYEHQYPACSTH